MVKKRAGRTRRVPAALHHELSEYASLLRALRVRDMMDLTKHLLKPNPFLTNDDTNPSGTPGAGSSDSNHPVNAQKQPKSAKARGKQKATPPPAKPKQVRRDHWTRWPLLLEDVPPPEWNLSDEVTVMASQVLKSRRPLAFPCPIASSDIDDLMAEDDEDDRAVKVMEMDVDSDDPDPPYYIPYLTAIMAKFLSTVFRILASHTPRRPASMQNRIEPLGWRSVIDVVVSCGIPEFANPKVVENIIKRMERLVGPSILPIEGRKATSFRAVERIKGKDAQVEAFDQLFAQEAALYWAPLESRPGASRSPSPDLIPVKKRKSKREREEEADYRARKHWNPKDKQDKQSKPKSKPPPKSTSRNSKKKPPVALSVDVEPQTASASNTEVPKTPEPPQPVRRSTRAKNNVNYRELPLDDIPLR